MARQDAEAGEGGSAARAEVSLQPSTKQSCRHFLAVRRLRSNDASLRFYAREAILRQIDDIEDDYLARHRLARGGARLKLERTNPRDVECRCLGDPARTSSSTNNPCDHRRVMSTLIGPRAAFTLLFVSCATTSSRSASEAPSKVALPRLAVIGTMNSPFFFFWTSGG